MTATRTLKCLAMAIVVTAVTFSGGALTASPARALTAAQAAIVAKPGDRGIVVTRIQNVMIRIGFLKAGNADGYYGLYTTQQVKSFQTAAKIPVTGIVNQHTYEQMLVRYNRLPAPAPVVKIVAKPGDSGATVTQLQRILTGVKVLAPGYVTGTYSQMTTNAVKAFQTKYRLKVTGVMDQPVTYAKLVSVWTAMGKPLAPLPSSGTRLDARCYSEYKVICVNKTTRKLYYVVNGSIQKTWDIRTGRPGYATREGSYRIYLKQLKSWSRPYQVWMPYAMYFDGGEAIHYSYEFANYGYGVGSHGCVNMRDWNGIQWLYGQVNVGDKVVVYS